MPTNHKVAHNSTLVLLLVCEVQIVIAFACDPRKLLYDSGLRGSPARGQMLKQGYSTAAIRLSTFRCALMNLFVCPSPLLTYAWEVFAGYGAHGFSPVYPLLTSLPQASRALCALHCSTCSW